MKQKQFQKQGGGRMISSLFLRTFMLLALVLGSVNSVWGQASSTSDVYKFKGTIAKKQYTPVMPYRTNLHEQSTDASSVIKKELNKGDLVTLFEVGSGKGFSSAGKFENGDNISDYTNFAICASGVDGGIVHFKLTFYYSGGNRYLDIYRHIADKNDGLAVISLQTPALFPEGTTGTAEINSIYKVDIQCFNYDNRHFQIESCYFITAMPDFDYTDIDGNEIGNAYVHPSYLIPSAGVIAYPSGEETGNPNQDDYIVKVKATTNFTTADGKVDWRETPKSSNPSEMDSTSVYNPTLVWSMNYKPYQDMSKVTYTTVDRWGGNAFWRMIFQKRVLAALAGDPNPGENVAIGSYKLWNSLNTGAQEVTAKDCANNFYTNTNLVYGNLNTRTQYVDLKTVAGYTNTGTSSASGTWKRIMFENNGGTNLPNWKFTVKGTDGVFKEVSELEGANASGNEQYSYDLEASFKKYSEIYLHALHGTDVNVKALYLGNTMNAGPYDGDWTNINNLTYVHGDGDPDSHVDNGDGGYGDASNVKKVNYVDLSSYDELVVKTNGGTVPSFRFNRWGDGGNDLISFDGNNTDYCSHNGDTWTVNLQAIKNESTSTLTGKAYLNCIKANYGSSLSLKEVQVVKKKTRILTVADFKLNKIAGETTNTPGANWKPVYGIVESYHNPDYYTDLSNKEMLELTATSQNPRFVFNMGTAGYLEIEYNSVEGKKYISRLGDTSPYVYDVNLTLIKTEKGMVHLNGIYFQDADGSKTMSKLVTKSNSSKANYTITNTDAQHYYNSVYNGDFTNIIKQAPLTDVNYIYFQINGNEYDRVYCDAATAESYASTNLLAKDKEGKVIGYYTNVDADGKLMSSITQTEMHIKDICITKNKVHARQNHANLVDLMTDKWCDLTASTTTDNRTDAYYGNSWKNSAKYADLTEYYSLRIKGTPNTEYQVVFNGGAAWDAYANGLRYVKLDANGYAELSLTDMPRIQAGQIESASYVADHLYLNGIYKTDKTGQTSGTLEYVHVVKDKDEKAEGVHKLVREDFHTWNGKLNATVTRQNANGSDFVTDNGFFKYDTWGQNTAQNYAELTGYKWIKVKGTIGKTVSVCANAPTIGTGNVTPAIVDEFVIGANGEGWYDISNHQYFHLHNITLKDGGTIEEILLIPDPRVDYVLEGNGVLGLDAANALMDKSACVIDARPRVNNKDVIDLYTEQVYEGNTEAWNVATCKSDYNEWQLLPQGAKSTRYIRMGNQNCIVMVRGDFDSTKESIGYGDITNIQYWHGIRSMHHANMAIIPADYDGTDEHKVMTAGLFLVDGYPYRIPMKITNVSGNSMSYARVLPTENAVVNTICVPFKVTLASPEDDNNSIHADAAKTRTALNGEATKCHFYKITDLVHNTTKKTETAGLLQQDHVTDNEYVFWFKQVEELDAYTPYVFVNRHNGETRKGTRMEVYSGWAGTYPTIEPTVDTEGKICQAMNNAAHKTSLNPAGEDKYYLYGTNATTHTRDCWFFNSEGYLVKSHYLSTPSFRAVMRNLERSIDDPFENVTNPVKVVSFDEWMNDDEEIVAVKTVLSEVEDEMVPVYSVNGILLRPSVKLSNALEGLPQGIYIVGGKKAIKK